MLAAAVLACRLLCSACQPVVPLVLHALRFKLSSKKLASACKTLAIRNRSQAARYACGRRTALVCAKKSVSAVLEVARWRLG